MEVRIDESWRRLLQPEFDSPYFAELASFVKSEYSRGRVYPPGKLIFAAFDRTPVDKVKVVILGQDPYHEPGQAQGLAFYVPPNVRTPPSLLNIAKELSAEYPERAAAGSPTPDLLSWADQGVLLLNATLTVAAGRAGSHQGRGWETFTDAVVRRLAEARENLVFLLWGSYAQRKGAVIDRSRHLVLTSAHPSPLSATRGFFGCNHFRSANDYLASHGMPPIRW
ncbi:MAG: uracil-DNA glycosylase [Kiritimatiellae bacterium]|nr:uracil-DNA glycosylase [Kiritimatiellia bacterium]MBR0066939.1 uracil-DNA glycosylase [Kiritimatiellia bacterium]